MGRKSERICECQASSLDFLGVDGMASHYGTTTVVYVDETGGPAINVLVAPRNHHNPACVKNRDFATPSSFWIFLWTKNLPPEVSKFGARASQRAEEESDLPADGPVVMTWRQTVKTNQVVDVSM